MGKARISISWEFMQEFLQIPTSWNIQTAYVEKHPYANSEPYYTLHIVIDGENIEEKDTPVELNGVFKHKVLDDPEGRWIQGHWEVFR